MKQSDLYRAAQHIRPDPHMKERLEAGIQGAGSIKPSRWPRRLALTAAVCVLAVLLAIPAYVFFIGGEEPEPYGAATEAPPASSPTPEATPSPTPEATPSPTPSSTPVPTPDPMDDPHIGEPYTELFAYHTDSLGSFLYDMVGGEARDAFIEEVVFAEPRLRLPYVYQAIQYFDISYEDFKAANEHAKERYGDDEDSYYYYTDRIVSVLYSRNEDLILEECRSPYAFLGEGGVYSAWELLEMSAEEVAAFAFSDEETARALAAYRAFIEDRFASEETSESYELSVFAPLEALFVESKWYRDSLTVGSQSVPTDATELSLYLYNISDISNLQYCTKLETLSLQNNVITDISPLAGLTGLKNLYLENNRIEDLSPLAELINLETLRLDNNQISDLSPLSGLSKLRMLTLENNQITAPDPLSGLPELNFLLLSGNQIESLDNLRNLPMLGYLTLDRNKIKDLSPLAAFERLYTLSLGNNQIEIITALGSLREMSILDLRGNNISDISPLGGLTDLEELILDTNRIGDIKALAGLTKLKKLSLGHNQVSDIGVLAELADLDTLYIYGNPVTSSTDWSGVAHVGVVIGRDTIG